MRKAMIIMTVFALVCGLLFAGVCQADPPATEGGPGNSIVQSEQTARANEGGGGILPFVAGGGVLMLALGMAVLPSVKDAKAKLTLALPASNTTVYATPGFDTGVTTAGMQNKDVEYILTAPALTTQQLGDAATMKYSILMDSVNPIDAASTALFTDCIVQTGAGGAGAAGAEFRFRYPSDGKRIIGFKVVNSANVDASGASATLEAVF